MVAPALVVALAGCDVAVTEKGSLPDVDVDVEGGSMPDVDAVGPSIGETEITVPTLEPAPEGAAEAEAAAENAGLDD